MLTTAHNIGCFALLKGTDGYLHGVAMRGILGTRVGCAERGATAAKELGTWERACDVCEDTGFRYGLKSGAVQVWPAARGRPPPNNSCWPDTVPVFSCVHCSGDSVLGPPSELLSSSADFCCRAPGCTVATCQTFSGERPPARSRVAAQSFQLSDLNRFMFGYSEQERPPPSSSTKSSDTAMQCNASAFEKHTLATAIQEHHYSIYGAPSARHGACEHFCCFASRPSCS